MKKIFLFICLIALSACNERTQLPLSHYNFDLKIYPDKESLSADLQLNYVHDLDSTDSLYFYLHRNLKIEYLECNHLSSWYFEPSDIRYIPEAKKLVFVLNKKISRNDKLKINIKYKGEIGIIQPWESNRITSDWIELNNYSPWFLYSPKVQKFSLEGIVEIDQNYILASNAHVKKDELYHLTSEDALNDIVVTASKKFKSLENKNNDLEINLFYHHLSDDNAKDIVDKGFHILNTYCKWFGKTSAMKSTVVIADRKRGGGYTRNGIIFFSEIQDSIYQQKQIGYVRYFAHEYAHLWWYKADVFSWEDWLNESFAEYSALMIIRDVYGEDEFISRITTKSKDIDSMPPVIGIDRSDKFAYSVLYNKCCVILWQLEERIGRSDFMKLLLDVHKQKINNTEALLVYLNKQFGESVSKEFLFNLNK